MLFFSIQLISFAIVKLVKDKRSNIFYWAEIVQGVLLGVYLFGLILFSGCLFVDFAKYLLK